MARRARKVKKAGRRPGRVDTYHPSFVARAVNLALLGLTHEEIAGHFGMSYAGFRDMGARHPELTAAIKEHGAPADGAIANALYQRAKGFLEPVEKVFYNEIKDKVVRVNTFRQHPPSEVAAMMWLSNRQRETKRWAFRQSTDLTNSDGSFAEFVKALQEQHRTLQGRFRVVEPERLAQDAA